MKSCKFIAPFVLLLAAGCSSGGGGGSTQASGSNPSLPLIALSQANASDPWRQVFDAETKELAAKHASDFQFEEQAADDDPNKQNSQIETLMLKSPKVLLVSPTTEAVKTGTDKAFDAGIPVVLLDRGVPGDKYTCLIAGDNVEIGRQAGKFLVAQLKGKGTILMIQGLGGATPTEERRRGAMEEFAKSPGIKVIVGDDCKYQRQAAQNYMESVLQSGRQFDAVYAHNDEMAMGAYQAWSHSPQAKGKRPLIVGIDGCQKEMVDYIKNGQIDATFQYAIPGPAGLEVAAKLLKGEKPKDKKIVLPTQIVTKDNADKYLADNPNLAK